MVPVCRNVSTNEKIEEYLKLINVTPDGAILKEILSQIPKMHLQFVIVEGNLIVSLTRKLREVTLILVKDRLYVEVGSSDVFETHGPYENDPTERIWPIHEPNCAQDVIDYICVINDEIDEIPDERVYGLR